MSPLGLGNLSDKDLIWIIILIFWSFFWKGYAVWTAAERKEVKWFIPLLVINTLGIFEIFYLFVVAKKQWSDVTGLFEGVKKIFK